MPVAWPYAVLTLHLSNICMFGCRHCYRDSRHEGPEMSPAEVVGHLADYSARGGRQAAFHGGEPTLSLNSLVTGLGFCKSHGIHSTLTSNCWWGGPDYVAKYANLLATSGLSHLIASFDLFHAEFNSWENVLRAIREVQRYGVEATLTWVSREEDFKAYEDEIKSLVGPVGLKIAEDRLKRGPGNICAVGRAKDLPGRRRSLYWMCHHLKAQAAFVGVEPGHRLTLRCGLSNPAMTFDFEGDVTEAADRIEDSAFIQDLKARGMVPLFREYKALGYRDCCEFCYENMADWRTKHYGKKKEAVSAHTGHRIARRDKAAAGRRRRGRNLEPKPVAVR